MATKLNSLLVVSVVGLSTLTGCYNIREAAEPINPPIQPLEKASESIENNPIFTVGETLPSCWWEIFKDSQLSCFIGTALNLNPDIQTAFTRIELASFEAEMVRSALFPSLSFSGYVTRNHITKTGALPPTPPGSPFFLPFDYTLYDLQLNLMYDFDLWFKNRNALYAAVDEVYAQMAENAIPGL